jgi:hypothetical protein
MVLFVSVCLTLGIVSIIVAYRRESHPYKKIERLLTNWLALPLFSGVIISYVFYVFEIDLFQQNYILAIVIFPHDWGQEGHIGLGNAAESMDRRGVLTVGLSETSKAIV